MKVIFLDIDGVLNTFQTFTKCYYEYKKNGIRKLEIDENKVYLLKQIVDNTNALIVLSSSWRKLGRMENNKLIPEHKKLSDLLDIFKKYNLSIYDITPGSSDGNREFEIRKWLENTSLDIDNFIVIDDDISDLMGFVNKELIRTYFMKTDGKGHFLIDKSGLTIDHVYEAIDKLNNKKILVKNTFN